ncbi:MAG: tetraacyldisaccharide 4'-kinase [Bacteroidales bacterium]|nr:tetraacyldisaccharide 4'-kinase [Bacteroidales bacterium]
MLGILSKTLLFPYWLVLKTRHFLYDSNIIKGRTFDVPVVCVGNITVGGTGKTPHTEMLLRMLAGKYNVRYSPEDTKERAKALELPLSMIHSGRLEMSLCRSNRSSRR